MTDDPGRDIARLLDRPGCDVEMVSWDDDQAGDVVSVVVETPRVTFAVTCFADELDEVLDFLAECAANSAPDE